MMDLYLSNSTQISALTDPDTCHSVGDFHKVLDLFYDDDLEEKERYMKGYKRIVGYFQNNNPNVDIRIGMCSIEIFYKKYIKSWIPFCSYWKKTKTIEITYPTSIHDRVWRILLYRKTRGRFSGDAEVGIVKGYKNSKEGRASYKISPKDRSSIKDIMELLERLYIPNSIDFIMEP